MSELRICRRCGWAHDDQTTCLEVLEGMAASATREADDD